MTLLAQSGSMIAHQNTNFSFFPVCQFVGWAGVRPRDIFNDGDISRLPFNWYGIAGKGFIEAG